MEPSSLLEVLRREGARLSRIPDAALDLTVPTMPDWTVERVLRHTGKVHRWVHAAVAAGPDGEAEPIESLPRGAAAIEAYSEALTNVVATLEAHDPDEPAWTFQGPGDVRFWIRRQAHEVTVHRVDAESAIAATGGDPVHPLAVDGAVDGIDEWLEVFLTSHWAGRGERPPAEVRGSFHLHGTAGPAGPAAEWLVTIDETVEIERVHVKGDAALRGSAEALFLTLWRRRPLDALDLRGDTELVHRLLDTIRI